VACQSYVFTSPLLGSCFLGSRLLPVPEPSVLLPWLNGSNLPLGLLLKPAPLLLVMGRACKLVGAHGLDEGVCWQQVCAAEGTCLAEAAANLLCRQNRQWPSAWLCPCVCWQSLEALRWQQPC
jgi:hypothetical protein